MYAVLLVISIGVLLFIIGMGVIGYYLGGYAFFSFTHRAVLIRLLEHGLTSVCGGLLMFVGVGLRVGFEHYVLSF